MRASRLAAVLVPLSLLTIPGPAPASTPPAARLGTDVVPRSQEIHLRLDADSSRYAGWVRAELDVRRPTRTFRLHARGQDLGRVTLAQNGRPVAVTHARDASGVLTLTTAQALAHGTATLEIRFTQAFNTQAVALYRMEREGAGYAFTQFQAEDAREAFPCWDEPAFKIPWRMTLEVPARHAAVFNTPIEREETEGEWRTVTFRPTPPLPSYLLAIATGPLEFVPIPGVRVPARVVTVKGQKHLAGIAAEGTARILAPLEVYFGEPYPFEKLDLIAIPEFWAGAMENPGAITYADNILLLDPRTASIAQRKNLVRVTAHELAHMWFGDLVTMAWWDDFWLNESFADWMGDKITEQVAPEYHHQLDELGDIQEIMATDARPSTDAVRQRVASGNDAMRSVGLAYNKGKAVLAMFEQWIGPDTFRDGVRAHLRAHRWGNATSQDLWRALGKASGKDVLGVLSGFIEQPGFPLVTVEPLGGGRVRLTQRRFLNHGVKAEARTWRIPIGLDYFDGTTVRTQRLLLAGPTGVVRLEGAERIAWVMPNDEARGYYRWKAPREMLLALARDAQTAMSRAERIGFLGNLGSLLAAGEVSGDTYLDVLAMMAGDPEPLVAEQVLAGMDRAREAFVADSMRESFARYVRRALRPMADRFGLEKRKGEPQAVSLVRPDLLYWLGAHGGDPAVLAMAATLAERAMKDPAAVDPAIAGVVLRVHATRGDRALFDRYRKAFEAAKQPALKRGYLNALGAFADPALEAEALRYTIEGPLRPNELSPIPRAIAARSEAGADRVLAWIEANWDAIRKRLPESFLPFLSGYCRGCSAERLASGLRFFGDPARRVPGMDQELREAKDYVNDCVGLRRREGAAVAAYLDGVAKAQ